jgi:hypothetical protein
MKCIKNINTGAIKRVSDRKAVQMLRAPSAWEYCSKHEWKEAGRPR